MRKVCVVTACGNKKQSTAKPAYKLYKSSRITAVYNRKGEHDMYILSAEHGLLHSEKITEPYNRIMDEQRCLELIPKLKPIIEKYDTIVFFKAGARGIYEKCLKMACNENDVKLVSFGFGFMGGINELKEEISKAERGQ